MTVAGWLRCRVSNTTETIPFYKILKELYFFWVDYCCFSA